MVLYPYVAALAFDPATKTVAANATGQVYAKADTTYSAPLATVDASGQPIELTTNEDGVLPSFYVDGQAGVNWKSGSWVFPLVSSEPLPGPEGPRGTSIAGVSVVGDTATFELSDGTTTAPVTLPTAAGGSNAGVAEYIRVDGPTKTELNNTYIPANPALTVTYNADGSVASTSEDGVTTTYTYNTDGTVATQTRAGITKTFTYDANGNVTGAA